LAPGFPVLCGARKMLSKKSQLLLLLLPFLLVACALYFNHGRGPYWLGNNLDPEYVYLLNGLNLAQLKGVGHIDHPGTPVQVLAAVTIRIVYTFTGPKGISLETDVLTRPEIYLELINRILIVQNAIMLLLVGLVAYRLSGSLPWSLWLQAAPFFSPVLLLFGLTRVTPEPLLFFASSGVLLLAILTVFPPDLGFSHRQQWLLTLGWAVVIGLGIACKITFLPLVVIPLVVLPRMKQRFFYLAALVGAVVVFTLPIIRMYPLFWQWVFNLVTHSGHYGSGPSKMLPLGQYFQNLWHLLIVNPFFAGVLLITLSTLFLVILLPRLRRASRDSMELKLLSACALAQCLALAMVSKHAASHYLLPVLNLSGLMVFLLFFYWKKQMVANHSPAYAWVLAIVFFSVICISAVFINPPVAAIDIVRHATHVQEVSLALHQQVEDTYRDHAKIYYYRCSAPEYALKFGSDLSRSYHAETLDKLYANVYFYDIWTNRFTRFDYNTAIPFEIIQAKFGTRIIFQGRRGQKIPGLKLQNVATLNSQEGIFTLQPTITHN